VAALKTAASQLCNFILQLLANEPHLQYAHLYFNLGKVLQKALQNASQPALYDDSFIKYYKYL